MARCEECLHFEVCEALEQGNGLMKVSPIHCGYYKNAADVVPKSECEKWYHEYHVIKEELKQEKAYHKETEKLADRYCVELHTAKSEVAREIVEIINDRIDNIRARTPYGGRAQGKTLAVEKMRLLETLKVEIVKKYTEDKG